MMLIIILALDYFTQCLSQPVSSITYDQFANAVTSNPPEGNVRFSKPSQAIYNAFINSAGSKGKIGNKQEAAMALANILQESDGLKAKREYGCEKSGCPGKYKNSCDVKGQNYYGRGYIQLTWCYNYRDASKYIFNDQNVLLKDADRVAREEQLSWDTAFWFWATRVHPRKGVQNGQFGDTIRAINGGECTSAKYRPKAERRKKMYVNVRKAFGLPGNGDLSGC